MKRVKDINKCIDTYKAYVEAGLLEEFGILTVDELGNFSYVDVLYIDETKRVLVLSTKLQSP